MPEEKKATVFLDEIAAIRESRIRDQPLFVAVNEGKLMRWVVAVSEHQANLALVEHIWPITKIANRARDDRYTVLLEEAMAKAAEGSKESQEGIRAKDGD